MNHDLNQLYKFVSSKIIFGAGYRHSVANYVKTFGARKVLLAFDLDVLAVGRVTDIQASLEGQGIDYCLYTNISSNPRVDEVILSAKFYRSEGCNVIVAVDGGNPMGCAKGIGIVAAHGRGTFEFKGIDRLRVPSPPLILIPTTAGTSADVSQFAITSNQGKCMKFSVVNKAVVPNVSLIDPGTTLTTGPFLSVCTGIDAPVHVIEVFVSTGHGPLTNSHTLEAMRPIDDSLVQVIVNPDDIALCEKIMLGSMQTGLAFSNAILGAVHAISHSLGGYLNLPHDLRNVALVEHVMVSNYSATPECFKVIAETFDIDCRGLTQGQVRQRLVDYLIASKHAVGFHGSLALHGVGSFDIPFPSRHAMQDPCILTSPRESNQRDVEVIYGEVL